MKSHNKTILTLLLLLSVNMFAAGQEVKEEQPPLSERLFFGGSLGLQFGTITYIDISPVVGLWVLPRVAIAGGPSYMYYKFRNDQTSIYGGRLYTQYVVLHNLNDVLPIGMNTGFFLHLEAEALSLETSYWKYPYNQSGRFMANNVLFGGGIRQQMGTRSFLHLSALWKIHDSGYSMHSSPEIRVGFSF
jgi:hypothetical protein